MHNEEEATFLVKKAFPGATIVGPIEYQKLFIFQVYTGDPLENGWDPFVAVDRVTNEVRDYSILGDGGGQEICSKFETMRGGV